MSRYRKGQARREDSPGSKTTTTNRDLDWTKREKNELGNKTRVSHRPGAKTFLWSVERVLETQLSDLDDFKVFLRTFLARV